MTSAKDQINKMINKRQTYNRKNRIAKALQDGHRNIIIDFVKAMEKLRLQIEDPNFSTLLYKQCVKLESRIHLLDEFADINIYWFEEDELAIDTITIDWSPAYVKRAKLTDGLYVFDVPKYILEGVFFE